MMNGVVAARAATAGILLLLTAGPVAAAGRNEVSSSTDRINYSVGYQIGGDFRRQGVELTPETLVQGIRDALQNDPPRMSPEEMRATLVELKKKIMTGQKETEQLSVAGYRKEEEMFLQAYAGEAGVTRLPDGVLYKVLRAGTGARPGPQDEVRIHYRITQVDGKEVASTYVGGKPRTYPLAKAIPGLQEALLLMPESSKWQVVIPPTESTVGREPLEGMGVMIYDLELLSVIPAARTGRGSDLKKEQS